MKPLLLTLTNFPFRSGKTQGRQDPPYRPPINFLPVFLLLLLIALIWKLIFGYQKGAIKIEDIESRLSPEELKEYKSLQDKIDRKYERCIQYILYAAEDGRYQCLSCPPAIPFVTLKKGEIWYIGHTCQEEYRRHSRSFRNKHNVIFYTNYVGSKEECHKLELKLIRGYKYLPESKKPEIKLVLPPYNQTDKN